MGSNSYMAFSLSIVLSLLSGVVCPNEANGLTITLLGSSIMKYLGIGLQMDLVRLRSSRV